MAVDGQMSPGLWSPGSLIVGHLAAASSRGEPLYVLTSMTECSKRWHEVVKPGINRDRWSFLDVGSLHLDSAIIIQLKTETQDHMLEHAVRAHGRAWLEIVERYFPERTQLCVRNRSAPVRKKT